MNKSILAVTVGALLVAGVATAAYVNQRDVTGPRDDVRPYSTAAAHEGDLEWAEVVKVAPVTRLEPRYATVTGTSPVRETTTSEVPREVCNDVVVQERLPERDGNVGGTVAGAIIGGLVGNQVGDGNGRKAATAAGAVAGGFIGNRVDRNHQGGQVVSRTDRQCRTVTDTRSDSRTVAWDVDYRAPDGTTGTLRTNRKPGAQIALGEAPVVVGYDVTYRHDGDLHQVRMDQDPGERLPVLDGQVLTTLASTRVSADATTVARR